MLLMSWWNSFVDLIEWGLVSIADVTGNGGLAIIVFTILIKTILLPLTVKSVRSTANMQALQPKIKELQKKYGKDRQRLSQETMKLYSEYNINPAAGCLPLLLQMPIFFGLFFAIRRSSQAAEGHFADSFLWIGSLAEADNFTLLFIPLAPLAILAGIAQFIQMRMMRPRNQGKVTDPQQAMMQMMMNFMPLMVVVFGWTFPAGVVLYWVAQSVYSVIQQWFITGWGAVGDWFPWLPELPDHRRLGYKKPQEANVVVSGEPAQLGGVMGWMQRKAGEMEEKKAERGGARGGTKTAATIADEEPEDTYEYDEEESFEPEPADGVIRVRASGGKVKRTGGTLVQKSTVNESAVEQTSNGASSRPKPVPRRQRGGKRKAAGG
jgi:YidC/Oxa1 family membrane protein insertase